MPGKRRHIPERYKASNERELLMEEILDNITDAFYVVDHQWRIVFVNRASEALWNRKREELLGKVFWDCFPIFEGTPVRSMHESAREKATETHWEAVSPDRQFWGDVSAYPTRNGGLAVFFRNTTEQKRAEQILQASEQRQAIMLKLSDSLRLLDNPDDIQEAAACLIGAYLGVDTAFYCDVVTIDGTEYFQVNRAYTNLDKSTLLGLHSIDSPGVLASENQAGRNIIVYDMETDPRIGDDLRPTLRARHLGAWVAVPLIRNGRYLASFTVQQATPRYWTPEEIDLIQETTARTWAEVDRVRAEIALRESEQHARRLVAELEDADRNKNAFLNALSHELRNPLAAIVAGLSMLDIVDQNPDTKKPKEIIKRQTDQLCHLVDDLLDMTRIANNKIQLKLETIDLNTLAQSAALDHRTLFSDKDITLETDICGEPLYVRADPVRLSQVIDNLLHNAYKFTEKNGTVTLATEKREGEAVITVRDNGIGIEPSFLPELFKSFLQAGHHKGGLGLGLSIVKGIVELHGGRVTAESEGLNKGAAFSVILPLSSSRPEAVNCEQKCQTAASRPLTILLIDDNRDLIEMTGSFLTLLGYDVESAFTGAEGIEKAKAHRPHVVICDIGLPDIDGYQVARTLSGIEELKNTCLISLSGYAQAGDFELSKEAGYDMHISKPIDFKKLKSILDDVVVKV